MPLTLPTHWLSGAFVNTADLCISWVQDLSCYISSWPFSCSLFWVATAGTQTSLVAGYSTTTEPPGRQFVTVYITTYSGFNPLCTTSDRLGNTKDIKTLCLAECSNIFLISFECNNVTTDSTCTLTDIKYSRFLKVTAYKPHLRKASVLQL